MSIWNEITVEQTEPLLESGDPEWQENGVSILKGFMPNELIDAYIAERTKRIGNTEKWRPGWSGPTPYLHVESMRNLALYEPLQDELAKRIGNNRPGLHLCLTGFQSTERAPHQDRYLNPDNVGQYYIAVWIALDDIHENSGPFTYVPGSHKWDVIIRDKVIAKEVIRKGGFDTQWWPSDTQDFVGQACNEETERRGVSKVKYLPKKGDVLIWHASLIHEGSPPIDNTLERRALICHYSSINHRPDMATPVQYNNGIANGFYFPFDHELT